MWRGPFQTCRIDNLEKIVTERCQHLCRYYNQHWNSVLDTKTPVNALNQNGQSYDRCITDIYHNLR